MKSVDAIGTLLITRMAKISPPAEVNFRWMYGAGLKWYGHAWRKTYSQLGIKAGVVIITAFYALYVRAHVLFVLGRVKLLNGQILTSAWLRLGKFLNNRHVKTFLNLMKSSFFRLRKVFWESYASSSCWATVFFRHLMNRKRVWIVFKINSLHVKHYMNIVFTFFHRNVRIDI